MRCCGRDVPGVEEEGDMALSRLAAVAVFGLVLPLAASCRANAVDTPAATAPAPSPTADGAAPATTLPAVALRRRATPIRTPAPPTATAIPGSLPVTPVATAAGIFWPSDDRRDDGSAWSQDRRFLAYWTLGADEYRVHGGGFVEKPERGDFPTGELHLLDALIGQSCLSAAQAGVGIGAPGDAGSAVRWLPDGRVRIGWQVGRPCHDDFETVPTPEPTTPPDQASPNGQYRVVTAVRDPDRCFARHTTLVDTRSGATVAELDWTGRDYEDAPCGMDPRWVSGDTILIPETAEQGPVLLSAREGVVALAKDRFGLEDLPWDLTATGTAVDDDGYAILLHPLSGNVPLRLYRSVDHRVESLPLHHLIAFSPDGRWIAAWGGEDPAHQGHPAWIRRMDDVDGEWMPLDGPAEGWGTTRWSPDSTRLAMGGPGSVSVFAVPDGRRVAAWDTRPYGAEETDSSTWLGPWSPDGRWLVASGVAGNQMGLFVIDVMGIADSGGD